jgi:hypothetical protein
MPVGCPAKFFQVLQPDDECIQEILVDNGIDRIHDDLVAQVVIADGGVVDGNFH